MMLPGQDGAHLHRMIPRIPHGPFEWSANRMATMCPLPTASGNSSTNTQASPPAETAGCGSAQNTRRPGGSSQCTGIGAVPASRSNGGRVSATTPMCQCVRCVSRARRSTTPRTPATRRLFPCRGCSASALFPRAVSGPGLRPTTRGWAAAGPAPSTAVRPRDGSGLPQQQGEHLGHSPQRLHRVAVTAADGSGHLHGTRTRGRESHSHEETVDLLVGEVVAENDGGSSGVANREGHDIGGVGPQISQRVPDPGGLRA